MDTYAQLNSFSTLRNMRDMPGANQELLAPQEHRAFAREWTQENPLVAVPSLVVATPLYAAAKALGLVSARTKPSVNQVVQGYTGILDGLKSLSSR